MILKSDLKVNKEYFYNSGTSMGTAKVLAILSEDKWIVLKWTTMGKSTVPFVIHQSSTIHFLSEIPVVPPRPNFQIGDIVSLHNGNGSSYTIIAIVDNQAWVKSLEGNSRIFHLSLLQRL